MQLETNKGVHGRHFACPKFRISAVLNLGLFRGQFTIERFRALPDTEAAERFRPSILPECSRAIYSSSVAAPDANSKCGGKR